MDTALTGSVVLPVSARPPVELLDPSYENNIHAHFDYSAMSSSLYKI